MNYTDDANETNLNLKNNDTLLISEIKHKVVFPYTRKEIEEILRDENNEYKTVEEVIEGNFTRPFSDFRWQFISRYNEAVKLLTKREKYSLTDGITLGLELMKKRYLHPAVIAACRSLDELDVYLDCLDKNELDDFKIFKIKYELHPMIVKNKGDILAKTSFVKKVVGFFKKIFIKKPSENREI